MRDITVQLGDSVHGPSTPSGGSTTCPGTSPAILKAATDARDDAEAVPYARPIRGQPPNGLHHPIEALGWFSHDNDAILAGTWGAARGAVDVTLSAWRAVADGSERSAYALARPPGHHAAADSYAGYCFLNNAATAAAAWAARDARVAILDVDYHHGNGTQQIFSARGDVCFVQRPLGAISRVRGVHKRSVSPDTTGLGLFSVAG